MISYFLCDLFPERRDAIQNRINSLRLKVVSFSVGEDFERSDWVNVRKRIKRLIRQLEVFSSVQVDYLYADKTYQQLAKVSSVIDNLRVLARAIKLPSLAIEPCFIKNIQGSIEPILLVLNQVQALLE